MNIITLFFNQIISFTEGIAVLPRRIDKILEQWGKSRSRRPLLIRGTRQVGKTYSIQALETQKFQIVYPSILKRDRNFCDALTHWSWRTSWKKYPSSPMHQYDLGKPFCSSGQDGKKAACRFEPR